MQRLEKILDDNKGKIGFISRKQYQADNSTRLQIRFKELSDKDPEPSMAYLLAAIMPQIAVMRLPDSALEPSLEFTQGQHRLQPTFSIEIFPNNQCNELSDAIDFICDRNLIETLKNNIGCNLTPEDLTKKALAALESASTVYNKSYIQNSKTGLFPRLINLIDLPNIHEKARASEIEERVNIAKQNNGTAYESLLTLLNDNSTGNGVRSYKYALVRTLLLRVGGDKNDDKAAARLIELTRTELARKIKCLPVLEKEPAVSNKL